MANKVVDQLNVPESFVRLTTTFSPDTKTTKFDLVVPGQPVMKTGMTYVGFELTLENLIWLRNTLTKYIGDGVVQVSDLIKALEAGNYDAAPSELKQGSEHLVAVEDLSKATV